MEGAQDNQLRRLVQEEEEEEEQAAENLIQQLQGEEEEDEPSEAASKGKSEDEIQETGSAFLGIVLSAIEATEDNDDIDQKTIDRQNLETSVE